MRRREFITLAGGTAVMWPLAARAQQPLAMLRVGTVGVNPRSIGSWVAFERRMSELGYQEGKNFVFDYVRVPTADAQGLGSLLLNDLQCRIRAQGVKSLVGDVLRSNEMMLAFAHKAGFGIAPQSADPRAVRIVKDISARQAGVPCDELVKPALPMAA